MRDLPVPEIVQQVAGYIDDSATLFALLQALHPAHVLGQLEPLRRLGLVLPREALWPHLCAVLDARPGGPLPPEVFEFLPLAPIRAIRSGTLDTSIASIASLTAVLPGLHHLRRLELTLVNVTAVEPLLSALSASTITELVLEGRDEMYYRDDADQVLADSAVDGISAWLEIKHTATTLSLANFCFQCERPTSDRFMLAMQQAPALTTLQLNHCRNRLDLRLPRTLEHLTMSDTRSSLESHQSIIDTLEHPSSSLRSLDLSWHSMYPEYFPLLAEALVTSSLVQLDLSYSRLLDDGSADLASALPQTQLQDVSLGYNEITNTGGMLLATAMQDSPRLQRLSLQGNFLGELSLKALLQAATSRAVPMAWVDLTNNDKVFATALDRLHAALRTALAQHGSKCVVLLDRPKYLIDD